MVRHATLPWIAPHTNKMINKSDRTKKTSKKDSFFWPKYKLLKNRVTNLLRRAVKDYYFNFIEKISITLRRCEKTIKKDLNKNQCFTSPRSVICKGHLIERQTDIAEAFNSHFITIGPKLAENIKTQDSYNPLEYFCNVNLFTGSYFEFHQIVPRTVEAEVNKLNCSKNHRML